jgi:hypothetical protein
MKRTSALRVSDQNITIREENRSTTIPPTSINKTRGIPTNRRNVPITTPEPVNLTISQDTLRMKTASPSAEKRYPSQYITKFLLLKMSHLPIVTTPFGTPYTSIIYQCWNDRYMNESDFIKLSIYLKNGKIYASYSLLK